MFFLWITIGTKKTPYRYRVLKNQKPTEVGFGGRYKKLSTRGQTCRALTAKLKRIAMHNMLCAFAAKLFLLILVAKYQKEVRVMTRLLLYQFVVWAERQSRRQEAIYTTTVCGDLERSRRHGAAVSYKLKKHFKREFSFPAIVHEVAEMLFEIQLNEVVHDLFDKCEYSGSQDAQDKGQCHEKHHLNGHKISPKGLPRTIRDL